MTVNVRARRLTAAWLLAASAAVCAARADVAGAFQDPVLARSRIIITGGGIAVSPAHQVVPRNMATVVETLFGVPGEDGGNGDGHADLRAAFPADAILVAELVGPSLGAAVTLTTRAGEPFRIQPLAIAGLHYLRGIRLVSGGATLLTAAPDTVTLEVIDRVLVSQVTSRPLSADEIRDRGIVIDETNYQVINFSAAFGFESRAVRIDFPMIVPARASTTLAPAAPPLTLPSLQPAVTPAPSFDLPKLVEAFQTANVSVGGLLLKVEDEDIQRSFNIPPLSGVIVIPGNIAYLNQFFSILTLVSNAAPGYSNLTAHDVRAEIVLPAGADTVPASGDDPLRMANLGSPPAPQPRSLPVTMPGPDGKLGTQDDIVVIAPQQSGNSEHLVEGLREGTHTIEVKVSAMLHGLPIGPVPISGRVLGTVEVRNPTFALTLSHPATVTAGEEYDLLVTVTNTSRSPANLASVNLLPRSISGATLLSSQSLQIETLAPGDSETLTFRLLSHTTGTVTATSFSSDGIPGRFELTSAVGALGIQMSPNTLVLPAAANALPAALRSAGVGFLGQAFALATSPVTPEGLLPLGQQLVYDRGTILAQAGQRAGLNEPLAAVVRDLVLDWAGSEFARLGDRFGPTQESTRLRTEQDFRGFDALLRESRRGRAFLDAAGAILGADLGAAGTAAFLDAWAGATASRARQVSALAVPTAPGTTLALEIVDPAARRVGAATPGGAIQSAVPFGSYLPLSVAGAAPGQLAVISTPQDGAHEAIVRASSAGTFDAGLIVPDGDTLRVVTYSGISVTAGATARVRFHVGGTNAYALEIDDDGDGQAERSVPPTASALVEDEGPRLLGASRFLTGKTDASAYGQVIALVFSEEITKASAQDGLGAAQLTNYRVDGNQVLGAALQPGGRVVLLSLRDGVGPIVQRHVTVTGVVDRPGHALSPDPATVPIEPDTRLEGGTIAGRVLTGSGIPVAGARIRLIQTIDDRPVTISVKDADGEGRYSFDFVRMFPTTLEAVDPATGERGQVHGGVRHHGQRVDLDIILLGTGTVAGRALSPSGAPLRDAVVRVSSLTRFGEVFSALTDGSGAFSIAGVPVGNVTIEAAHAGTNARTLRASTVPSAGAAVVEDLTLIPIVQAAIQTGTVAGQVFRDDGVTPAAGVPVFTDRGGIATADSTGAFRIELLPVGQVSVRAIDQARMQQATVVTTVVADTVVTANLRLFGGTGRVRGVVLDADGQPVAGAQVGGGATLQITTSTGEFELADVPLGRRTISASHAASGSTGTASVVLTVPNETVATQVILEARGTIAGRVFDAAQAAVPGLRVFLLGPLNLTAVTDAAGGYRFDSVPVGSYQVSAFTPDFSDGNIVSTRVTFRGEVRVANVTFRGKGRVTGTVFAANGVTPLGARVGLSELKVRVGQLRPPENFHCRSNVQVGDVTVELPQCQAVGIGFTSEPLTRVIDNDVASGRFTFEDVFVGSVTVEAANALTPIVMTARGEVPAHRGTVDLQLRLAATSVVTGVVLLPDGQPAGPDVVVRLGTRTVVTDANSRFTHFEVPPGSFTLTATDALRTGFVGQSGGAVAPGVTAEIPIRLLGKGSISVEVRGVNGVVPNARVRVRAGGFPNEEREGFTGATGRILFAGGDALFEGPFSVSAFDEQSGVTGFRSGTIVRDAQTDVTVQLPNEAGTVAGTFLNPAGTQPVPNAQIRLSSAGGDAYATTLADGTFRFEGVRLGAVTIEAFDPVTARRGRATGALKVHAETLTLEVRQIAQGTVRGFVRLSTDESAVAGADVSISVNSAFDAHYRTTTNADGSFVFPGVSAGTVSLSATAGGLSGHSSGALATEGEVVPIDVVLEVPARGRVEGFVTVAGGAPALGAQVALGSRHTTVDNNGFYFFDDVGMGSVTVRASALAGPDGGVASGSLVYAGEVATVNVRFVGTGTVAGTVRSAGALVPFAAVTLSSRNQSGRDFTASTQTDGSGAFAFSSVPVGDVSVTAVQTATQLAGSASGTIAADGAALQLPVDLQPSAAVRARVVRESTGAPAAGMGVEIVGGSRRFGSTGTDGTLRFGDLALGTYQVVITDPLGEGLVRATVTLDQGGTEIDLGDLSLDEFYPEVVSIAPADGAARVPVLQPVVVRFSERIQSASLTPSAIVVSTTAGSFAGVWALSADGLQATFTPAHAFPDFAQVTVRVTTALRDRVGRALREVVTAGFQTTDSVPPAIASVSPAAGASGVAPAAVIRIGYSEAVDVAGFAGPAVELRRDGVQVPGTVAGVLNNTAVVFTPASPLQPNATYTVAVRPAADVFGNAQPQGLAYSFSTIDTLAPIIQRLVAVPPTAFEGSPVTVTAEIADAADVASVEFLVNGTVVSTDTAAPYQAAIVAASALRPSFTVSARAADRSGNISSPATIDVAVQSDTPPAAAILNPTEGATVNTGGSVSLRVRATDDRGVSRIVFQTSGPLTTSGAFNVNPAASPQDATFTVQIPAGTPPGPLMLRAAAIDSAGSSSPTAAVSMLVRDATAPSAQLASPAQGAGVDAGQAAAFVVHASDNGEVAAISLETTGAVVFSTVRQLTPPSSHAQVTIEVPIPSTVAEGQSLHVSVRARDAAGNESTIVSRTYPVIVPDTTPPVVRDLMTSSGSTRVLPGETASLRATVEDNAGVTALLFETHGGLETTGTVPVAPPLASGTVPLAIPIPASTPNGASVTVHVRARDAAGNVSDERTLALTVGDTAVPVLTVSSPAEGALASPGQTVTLRVTATDDTAVRRVLFAASGVFTASATHELNPPPASVELLFPVTLPAGTPAGTLVLTAEAFDTAGNSSGLSTRRVTVTDVVAPAVRIAAPLPDSEVDPRVPLQVSVEASDAVGVTQIGLTATGAATLSEIRPVAPPALARTEVFAVTVAVPPPAGGTLVLRASARDEAGNAVQSDAVSVRIRDVVPPAVAAVHPADGAAAVDPNTTVSIEFTEPMDGASLTSAALTLSRDGFAEPVTVSVSVDGRTVTLTPQARPLALNTLFTIGVGGTVGDRAGNPLGQPRAFTFRTIAPDTTAPRVQATVPAANAVGVSLTAPVDVTFTEPVDRATVTPQSFRVSIGGAALPGTLTFFESDARVRFMASAPFPTDAIVVVELTSAIADAAGNALRSPGGEPLTTPFTVTFVTGGFGITNPPAGVGVVENSSLLVEARASASAGIASVVFTVNGVPLAPVGPAPFVTRITVPLAAVQPTLTIQASGRNAQGTQIASDSRTVDVVVGLRASPPIAGVPRGGTRPVRFAITSPLTEPLEIALRAGNAAMLTLPANTVVLPAGQMHVDVPVRGEIVGNTALFGESARGSAFVIVSVGDVPPGTSATAHAAALGAAVLQPPSLGTLIADPGDSATLQMAVLSAPAAAATAVLISSSNPAVASATAGTVAAGQQTATIAVTTGAAGTAILTIRAGDDVRSFTVVVGSGDAARTSPVTARPVGVSVSPGTSAGQVIIPAPGQAGFVVRLLTAATAADVPVTVESSNPAVATAIGAPIPAGAQTAAIIVTAHSHGTAILTVRAGSQVRSLTIVVGAPSAGTAPPYAAARPVGLRTTALPGSPGVFAPSAATRSLQVRVLRAPAAANRSISIASSDPAVVQVEGPSHVMAGEQTVEIVLRTGAAGRAHLTFDVDGERSSIEILVDEAPSAAAPLAAAAPVGVRLTSSPGVGAVLAPAGVVSAATLVVPLLPAPTSGPVTVQVTSSHPSIVSIAGVGQAFTIPAGEQTLALPLSMSGTTGISVVTFEFGGERRDLLVVVGDSHPSQTPLLVAPVVGVEIRP